MVSSDAEVPAILLHIARGSEDVWISTLRQAIVHGRRKFNLPMPAYADEELRQLARGYVALVEEATAGQGRIRWDAYIESIIEGMAKGGITYPYLAHVAAGFQAGAICSWVAGVPEEKRPEAIQWLMAFFADYVGDVIDAGIRLEARSRADE
ncbi:hypothetical protein [Pendulispora albinea]|uniref:TetR family transcriptional regulator n=1 Tax=Pendulispora albinea TaxID=2741071 RepID=A0ABZ2M2E8_9BACT